MAVAVSTMRSSLRIAAAMTVVVSSQRLSPRMLIGYPKSGSNQDPTWTHVLVPEQSLWRETNASEPCNDAPARYSEYRGHAVTGWRITWMDVMRVSETTDGRDKMVTKWRIVSGNDMRVWPFAVSPLDRRI